MKIFTEIVKIIALLAYLPLSIADFITAAYYTKVFVFELAEHPGEEGFEIPYLIILLPLGLVATAVLAVLARKNKKALLITLLSVIPHGLKFLASFYQSKVYPDTPTLLTVIYWITLLASIFFTAAVIYVTVKSLKEDKPA
jgi:tellurite resistance protein TehA-like permease